MLHCRTLLPCCSTVRSYLQHFHRIINAPQAAEVIHRKQKNKSKNRHGQIKMQGTKSLQNQNKNVIISSERTLLQEWQPEGKTQPLAGQCCGITEAAPPTQKRGTRDTYLNNHVHGCLYGRRVLFHPTIPTACWRVRGEDVSSLDDNDNRPNFVLLVAVLFISICSTKKTSDTYHRAQTLSEGTTRAFTAEPCAGRSIGSRRRLSACCKGRKIIL